MKQGSNIIIRLSFLFTFFVILTPFSIVIAQEEEGAVEEIFWGDEDEEEDFGDFEDEFSDDEEGEEDSGDFDDEFSEEEEDFGDFDDEFSDDEFSDDEFSDDEFSDDEEGDDFSEAFEEDPEESLLEAQTRMGYTLNLIGSSPGFVNHQLRTYNSGMDFRATFEFPMLLEMGPFRFRLGAELGTFKFTNYKPIGGTYSGVHVTGILSFPAGPGQVRLGAGMVGKGFGFIAENSYGFAIGDALDLRVGVRSTTSFGAADDKSNKLGTVSWMDGILILGVSL